MKINTGTSPVRVVLKEDKGAFGMQFEAYPKREDQTVGNNGGAGCPLTSRENGPLTGRRRGRDDTPLPA